MPEAGEAQQGLMPCPQRPSGCEFAPAGDRAMDSYVIRIYRRDADDPRKCAGQAEIIETDEKKTFKNLDELLAILETRENGPPEKKRSKAIKL